MSASLSDYAAKIQDLAHESSLDYYPVEFEVVPPSFMMEIAVYGLPVRMPHWSFGVRYIYQLVQHKMGHSHIFEVVFPGNPGRAYLANTNSTQENTLVVAHVLGHADFSKNNMLFKRAQEQVGYHIVEQAASHARQIKEAIEKHGQKRVEEVLDAALSIEQHIDDHKNLNRPLYETIHKKQQQQQQEPDEPGEFQQRFDALPDKEEETIEQEQTNPIIPPHPEFDLLWFIAQYAPDMEGWERDIILAVREESFYFRPVFECNIMNEGWASYWHARLLREANFLPDDLYVDAMKAHSDVVRPHAADHQIALAINPYHLGFVLWEKIIEEHGLQQARRIMTEEADTGFVRNYLTAELADELGFFTYTAKNNGEIKANDWDIHQVHEAILSPKYNFGAPKIYVSELGVDGTLELRHDHKIDQCGLDLERATKVLEYIHRIWRRPVVLHTINKEGKDEVVKVGVTEN
jgi:stage V sporulation protein R